MPDIYRLRLTYTYGSAANATTVATNIDSILAGWSNPVVSQRVTRNTASLNLMIPGLTEVQAVALRSALWSTAHAQTRAGGKFSIVRSPDLD